MLTVDKLKKRLSRPNHPDWIHVGFVFGDFDSHLIRFRKVMVI